VTVSRAKRGAATTVNMATSAVGDALGQFMFRASAPT